jgi:hypothetical protein
MTTSTQAVLLFSYGALQNKNVPIANFGRQPQGREDALPGHARRMVAMIDPKVAALSGESHHANVEPSSYPEDTVCRNRVRNHRATAGLRQIRGSR